MYMSKYSVCGVYIYIHVYIAYDISIYMEHTCIIDQTIGYRNWIPFIPATPRNAPWHWDVFANAGTPTGVRTC